MLPMSASPAVVAGEVTLLLERLHAGDPSALDQLLPLVYDELRRAARRALARERPGHTLHATELVHEAFLRLAGSAGNGAAWRDRTHFQASAAGVMRHVLVEHARRRLSGKRGGGATHVTLGDAHAAFVVRDTELVALDEALARLGQREPRLLALVEYRFFGGLSAVETAAVLGVGERTVQRDWARARAWLHKELAADAVTS